MFAAYLGEELSVEDSVSINTERSFNSEMTTFEASYPLNLNFILKDCNYSAASDRLGASHGPQRTLPTCYVRTVRRT